MSNQSVGNRVENELARAVEGGLLPDSVQNKAENVLARLRQPVRLALMGFPGSGKSTLLNLLIGTEVLPDGVQLPTLQLTHGAVEQSICTLPDGSKSTLAGVDCAEIAALSPVFVEMQMPLPALTKISLLEVVAPNDQTAVHKASQWASKRCDIALWCTRGFDEQEQLIWAQMPDLIKDHAFLMLTRADGLQQSGALDGVLRAIHAIAADEFRQILPIATPNAIMARKPDGSVDKGAMQSSGGSTLITAILKQVEQGRQSAVDMAELLLAQHASLLEEADDTPDPVIPQQDVIQNDQVATEDATTADVSQLTTPEAAEPQPALVAPTVAKSETAQTSLRPATRDAYQHAVAYILEKGRNIADAYADMGDDAPSQVMAMTVEHIQWLSDYLNENGDDADLALQRARDTAFDAADMAQLMQMEKDDSAALEAVVLMLQLKRELQADLAA